MKALSLRISDLTFFLRLCGQTVKHELVMVASIIFCFFGAIDQQFSAENVRNIRAAGLGLVPNESPKAKVYGPCLVLISWLAFGPVTRLFRHFFKIDFKMCHILIVDSPCFANISRTN